MNKDGILELKLDCIDKLQEEIDNIRQLEAKRLYKIKELDWSMQGQKDTLFETWGYIECFNKESCRVCVVASNNDRYSDKSGRHRHNINMFDYYKLANNVTRAKRIDLPLLLGLPFRSTELELLFKGKKILMDE
jgi:hypothetical protein